MTRWGMIADLERCVGCQTCTAACRHSNATSPAVQWRKVLDIEAGSYPNVSRIFVPVGCQHCADPPCMHVCPSTATRQRADGIVTIDYDICIGCAYCEVACPYQARFLVKEPHYAYDAAMQNEVERAELDRVGVAQKCTFCSDRIDFGLENGLTPGVDPRASPACVNACIADALHFGDLDDPDSNVSRLLKEQKSFRMHEELATDPGFHYVYGKANDADTPKSMAAASAAAAGEMRTRGVEPTLQQHWDWKASGNFICGGMGSGLLIFTALAGLRYRDVLPFGWLALAIMALGLSMLMLKIGKPLRALYVLRQPRRSWMTREAWIAAVMFPLAALALWFENSALLTVASVFAVGFLFCQAMILQAAKGIPAWRANWVVPLILTTGFAEGCGLLLAAVAQFPALTQLADELAVAAVALALLRALAWRTYLTVLTNEGAPTRALAQFDAYKPWFLAAGVVLPAALIVIGLAAKAAAAPLFAIAGFSIMAAGAVLKFILVTRASFNQGFALTHTPVRGSGHAGAAVKPGWSMT
jgi:Fe-S-cluster-containing dehydrogenase component/DMSO reductase anchor subunit